jgi:phage tail sheath gpL-like
MFDLLARIRCGLLMAMIDLPPEIDQSDRRPRQAIAYDNKSGSRSLPQNAKRLLIVGQMLAGGTGIAGQVYDLVNAGDAAVLFEDGSMLDEMARAAYKAYPQAAISAVGVVDPVGGTVATLANTFATAAAMDGAYVLVYAGKQIVTPITSGDTATEIGAAHVAAVNAVVGLPFVAANAAGVVTYTSKHKGAEQNQLKLRGFFSVAGIGTTATLAKTYTPFAGGTLAADLTTGYAAASAKRYHERAIGLSDSASGTDARDEAKLKGDAEHAKGEVVSQSVNGTLSACTTLATALNAARNQVHGIRGTGTPPWAIAAGVAAVKCSESRAAMPYNFLPVAGIEAPSDSDRWDEAELKALLNNGVSPLVVLPGDIVAMYRSISTYFTNDDGAPDDMYFDIMVIQCFDRVREAWTSMFQTLYGRKEWADDDSEGLLPDFVATPAKVKLDTISMMRLLQAEGTVQHVEELADQIEINRVDSDAQCSLPTDFVESLQRMFGVVVRVKTPLAAA